MKWFTLRLYVSKDKQKPTGKAPFSDSRRCTLVNAYAITYKVATSRRRYTFPMALSRWALRSDPITLPADTAASSIVILQ